LAQWWEDSPVNANAADRAADDLYGLPLGDFTKARNDLARRLRKEGQRDEADAVKALRKPTAPAWALNQLARRRPKDVEQLLAAGKELREAHEALLAGGDRAALPRASAQERELVDRLARGASAVAAEAGTAGTAALDEKIRGTLHAAALDEETASELESGRLVREREAVGMFGAGDAEVKEARKPKTAAKPSEDAQSRDLKRQLAAARSEEQQAERQHATAAKAAERARTRAAEAQQRADEARATMREAERQEKDAAKAHQRAAGAVAAAEKKLR
jgi:hypothetical protein